MFNIYSTTPNPQQLGQIIGCDAKGLLQAELHHAVEPQFLQFFIIDDNTRSGRTTRTYFAQVLDIGYARQASNDANFSVYLHRRNQNPAEELSNDDQAIIAKNVISLNILGCIENNQIVESFTLPGILAFIRRPRDDEYAILAGSPLAQLADLEEERSEA